MLLCHVRETTSLCLGRQLKSRRPQPAFVKDMHAFHAAKTGLEKDEIAAR